MLYFRWEYKKRSYDPIDYESIDKVDFWVTEEEEAPPEFGTDDFEIENVIYEDNAIPILGESSKNNEGYNCIQYALHCKVSFIYIRTEFLFLSCLLFN